jgi:hypothetical protein
MITVSVVAFVSLVAFASCAISSASSFVSSILVNCVSLSFPLIVYCAPKIDSYIYTLTSKSLADFFSKKTIKSIEKDINVALARLVV